MGKKSLAEHGAASAHSAIPDESPAQQICHACKSRAPHFSRDAHSLAAALRRVVACRRELPGSDTAFWRIRNHGETIRKETLASRHDRCGCRRAPRALYLAGLKVWRMARPRCCR